MEEREKDNNSFSQKVRRFEEGYVYYQRLNDEYAERERPKIWHDLYTHIKDDVGDGDFSLVGNDKGKITEIGNSLIRYGRTERQKEEQLLSNVLGKPLDRVQGWSIKEFIDNFNEILIGKENYRNMLNMLNGILEKAKANPEYGGIDQSIASVSPMYYERSVKNLIGRRWDALLDTIVEDKPEERKAIIKDVLLSAIENSLVNMAKATDKFTGVQMWRSLGRFLRDINDDSNPVRKLFSSYYDVDKYTDLLEEAFVNEINSANKDNRSLSSRTTRSKFHNTIKWRFSGKQRANPFGGLMGELVNVTLRLGGALDGETTNLGTGRTMAKTDSFGIYTAEEVYKMDVGIMNQMTQSFIGNTSLSETVAKLSKFYTEVLSKINKGLVIFYSDKLFTIGNNFRPIRDGSYAPIEKAADILKATGSFPKIDKFIGLMYSTIENGMFKDKQGEMKEELRKALISNLMYLFFDDWEMLGRDLPNGANAIHVFTLDHINYPLSTLLIGAGEAIRKAADSATADSNISFSNPFVNVTFDFPKDGILYGKDNKAKDYEEAKERFEEQREAVHGKFKFQVEFFLNFRKILGAQINSNSAGLDSYLK